jgi:uncharacterized membrane protein YfhO
VLVLGEAYAPGWTATVDAKPAEVVAANLAYRAVVLPPGARRIVFEYACPGLAAGAIVAAAASLVAAIVAILRARARRRSS